MPAVSLIGSDLLPFAPDLVEPKASILVSGTIARTALFAPSILDADFAYAAAAQDLLTVAALRRYRADGGAVTTEVIGPYQVTVDNSSLAEGGLYTKSEMAEWARIAQLVTGTPASAVPVFSFPPCAPSWPDPALRWRRV